MPYYMIRYGPFVNAPDSLVLMSHLSMLIYRIIDSVIKILDIIMTLVSGAICQCSLRHGLATRGK